MIKLNAIGIEHILEMMDKATDAHDHATAGALYAKGLQIMADAKKITPKKDGFLRGSGYVTTPDKILDNGMICELGFGGTAKDYALRVHELPENSNWTAPGTGPKYLQIPFEIHMKGYAQWLNKKIVELLNSNFTVKKVSSNVPDKPQSGRKE